MVITDLKIKINSNDFVFHSGLIRILATTIQIGANLIILDHARHRKHALQHQTKNNASSLILFFHDYLNVENQSKPYILTDDALLSDFCNLRAFQAINCKKCRFLHKKVCTI